MTGIVSQQRNMCDTSSQRQTHIHCSP